MTQTHAAIILHALLLDIPFEDQLPVSFRSLRICGIVCVFDFYQNRPHIRVLTSFPRVHCWTLSSWPFTFCFVQLRLKQSWSGKLQFFQQPCNVIYLLYMTHPTPTIPWLGLVSLFKLDGCFGEPVRAHILNLNCQTVISADQIWTKIMLLCTSWAKMFSETDFSLLFHCNLRAFGPGCHYFPTWKQTQNRAN